LWWPNYFSHFVFISHIGISDIIVLIRKSTGSIALCSPSHSQIHETNSAAGRKGDERTKFHKSPYLRTLFALAIFSYNSITSTVLTYFTCTDINEATVVAAYPALHCDSSEYKGLRVLALALVVIVVAG
jgi:hypothetical protein